VLHSGGSVTVGRRSSSVNSHSHHCFFVVFKPEGTSTTEAEVAAEIDACVAFAIAFSVAFLDLRGQLTPSEDTLEVVEAPAAETAVSAEPAVEATVGSTTVRTVATEMDACVAFAFAFSVGFLEATVGSMTVHVVAMEIDACVGFAFAFSVGFFDLRERPKPSHSSAIEPPPVQCLEFRGGEELVVLDGLFLPPLVLGPLLGSAFLP
jgi:hypothetical protein